MKRVALIVAVLFAVSIAAALIWRVVTPRRVDADVLSGYIEGQSLYLSAPIAGAVTSVSVVEGQRIAPGAALFTIDAKTLAAQRAQAEGQLAQAHAQADAARASLVQAKAALASAAIQLGNAARDADRFRTLARFGSGAASAQDTDRALSTEANARAQRDASNAAEQNAAHQVEAADAAVAHAIGVVDEAQARLDQLSVRAPAGGRVEEVYYQTGEWAAANQAILSLILDDKVKVRFSCDACNGMRGARVIYVSPDPEYTPPVIYSRQARERLVFEVEALPDDPRSLNPGLPVDITPLTRGAGSAP